MHLGKSYVVTKTNVKSKFEGFKNFFVAFAVGSRSKREQRRVW